MDRFIKKREVNVFQNVAKGRCIMVNGWTCSDLCKELGTSTVFIGSDILKSQISTKGLIEFISAGNNDIVLDDASLLKNDLTGLKWIKENRKLIRNRIFIPCEFGKTNTSLHDEMIEMGYKDHVDKKKMDIFFDDTKEFIDMLITDKDEFDFNKVFGMHIQEPSNRMGIIHENYTSAKGITMDECSSVAEMMSMGDVLEDHMFSKKYSEIMHECFSIISIIQPAMIIKNRIPQNKIKPASSWTKHFNMKLKASQKDHWTISDPEFMQLVRVKPELILEFCKDVKGIHLINHTSFNIKLDIKKYKELLKKKTEVFVE